MDLKSVLKISTKDVKPLQPLSPERLNSIRPTSATTKELDSDARAMERASPQLSPTRKAHLFADYHPNARAESRDLGFGLPQSPSMPEFNAFRSSHVRTNSDVQGLVKRFEHLDVRDRDAEFMERKKRHEAELRRAQIAREEAESDVKRLREEVRKLKKDGDEGRDRERKVSKRLEVVMEEFAGLKDTHATQIHVFEKENRKARKEAFKSSSAVVKLQEELKATRNTLHVTQSNLQMEKLKVQQRDQDSFNAQYKSVALQEEIDNLKLYVAAVEQEKEALKSSLQEEEVARIAAQGMIVLPSAGYDEDDDSLLSSPKKRSPRKMPTSPLSDDKENTGVITKKVLERRRLEEEVMRERALRERAEQLVEFLRLECKFQCCFCQPSSSSSCDDILDLSREVNQTMDSIRKDMQDVFGSFRSSHMEDEDMDKTIRPVEYSEQTDAPAEQTATYSAPDIEMESQEAEFAVSEDVDTSVTLTEQVAEKQAVQVQEIQIEDRMEERDTTSTEVFVTAEIKMEEEAVDVEEEEDSTVFPVQPLSPQTPPSSRQAIPPRQRPSIRTITTTTTIPMQFSPVKSLPQPFDEPESSSAVADSTKPEAVATPVIDREAALAAIAYRRGRARSIAEGHATPRKQMIEGLSILQRRDISAPLLGQKTGPPAAVHKGSASVGRAEGRTV